LISKRAVFNIIVSILLGLLGFITNEKLNDIIELQKDNKKILFIITDCQTKFEAQEKYNSLFLNHIQNSIPKH
jgi:hypothetical protein